MATASLVKIEFGHGNSLSKGTRIIEHSYPHIITIMKYTPRMVKNHSPPEFFSFQKSISERKKGLDETTTEKRQQEFIMDYILSINLHTGLEMLPL